MKKGKKHHRGAMVVWRYFSLINKYIIKKNKEEIEEDMKKGKKTKHLN